MRKLGTAFRAIYLIFFLLYLFFRLGSMAIWYRLFNEKKYRELMWELDKL